MAHLPVEAAVAVVLAMEVLEAVVPVAAGARWSPHHWRLLTCKILLHCG